MDRNGLHNMVGEWLDNDEVRQYLKGCSPEVREVVWELRALVQEAAPQLQETISFNALCYSKPGQPYGVIGGNVCMICLKGDGGRQGNVVHLAFIHGASLADPDGSLKGKAKAKRFVPLRSRADIRAAAFRDLIRAAVSYDPGADGSGG